MNAQELFGHWKDVRAGLLQALDLLSEAQTDFVPRAGLWSLRQTVCHIAETEESWFRCYVTRELSDWKDYPAADYPTAAALKALLGEVHARTEAFFANDPDGRMEQEITLPWGPRTSIGWVTWHVLEHEIHHRGEVYLMLGLQGIEAPDV